MGRTRARTRTSSTLRQRLALVLMALLHVFATVAPVLAEGSSDAVMAGHIARYAGGWGVATPLMIAGVGIYQHLRGQDDFEVGDLLNRQVVGGLVGDFTAVAIFNAIGGALPMSPLIKTLFVTFGGFLGWEVGSGNLANADWLSIGAQAGAASLIHHGLQTLAMTGGLSLGPVGITAASVAGALAVAYLLDELRGGPEADAAERPAGGAEWALGLSGVGQGGAVGVGLSGVTELGATAPPGGSDQGASGEKATSGDGAPAQGAANVRDVYERLVASLEAGNAEQAQSTYQEYRSAR